MNTALILLLTGLVCAQAAPQFVFVIPPEFLKQMQKPVGEMSQFGQQPRIPVFPLESLLGSAFTPAKAVESLLGSAFTPAEVVVPAPIGEPVPVAEEPQQALESILEVGAVMPPTDVVVAEVASETVVQIVKEELMAKHAIPVETTIVEETPPVVQEAPIETVAIEEVIPVIQEVYADSPALEATTESTFVIQTSEPANIIQQELVFPIEEVVTPTIVEEVIIVEDVQSNRVEEVVIVEEVSPVTNLATTQGPVDVPAAPVDPRLSVDPRFLNYIYVNDAPDVVAAKVALFNLQASLLTKRPLLETIL